MKTYKDFLTEKKSFSPRGEAEREKKRQQNELNRKKKVSLAPADKGGAIVKYKKSKEEAFLTTSEIADFLHKSPSHQNINKKVSLIQEARCNNIISTTSRSDQIHRKINDISGFLSLSKYCEFKGKKLMLSDDKDTFLSKIEDLIEKSKLNYLVT